ncbi:MAG: chemotactic signal-response protein chel [Alphaproteobacteria bacterium]|nr:chemotactic signal-response protein chel [Alphaproteobacteria bacterium]
MNPTDSIGLSQQQLTAARQPAPLGTSDPAKARVAAESFESFFLGQFLEHMFTGIRTDGIFGGGQGETVYRSMMMQEYGKSLAANGGFGIADTVYKSILQIQEQEQTQ